MQMENKYRKRCSISLATGEMQIRSYLWTTSPFPGMECSSPRSTRLRIHVHEVSVWKTSSHKGLFHLLYTPLTPPQIHSHPRFPYLLICFRALISSWHKTNKIKQNLLLWQPLSHIMPSSARERFLSSPSPGFFFFSSRNLFFLYSLFICCLSPSLE